MNIIIYPSEKERVIEIVNEHDWRIDYQMQQLDLQINSQTIHLFDSNHFLNRYPGIDNHDVLKLYQYVDLLVLEVRKEKTIIDIDHIMKAALEIHVSKWMEEGKVMLNAFLLQRDK